MDSTAASNYRKPAPQVNNDSPEEDNSNSFEEVVTKIGSGIVQRLKYRFNLEGIQEAIENKKEKYSLGDAEED